MPEAMAFEISCTAFEYGEKIPVTHTCAGEDVSPRLMWDGEPKGTVTFALIMEDPDAVGGTFTHWIIYNIPAGYNELEKAVPIKKNLDNKAIQGKNDYGKTGYRGPCPPKGEEHRYFFRIFALRKKLPPESATNGTAFYQALKGIIIDQSEYMGRY
jgi:Raf kinase inhibitor-like YbhB/YbcL family protein